MKLGDAQHERTLLALPVSVVRKELRRTKGERGERGERGEGRDRGELTIGRDSSARERDRGDLRGRILL